MKIESITWHRIDRWLIVAVATDNGLIGYGESGLWAFPDGVAAIVDSLADVLHGADPLQREFWYQYVTRHSRFHGSAISAALSAIDIALWDIAGKHFDAPIHALVGGAVRDRIRLYVHLGGSCDEEVAESARAAASEGFTAVRFDPFLPDWRDLRSSAMIDTVARRVAGVRHAVGPNVDVCVECHFKLTAASAPAIMHALTPYHILFLEDPVPPGNFTHMAQVTKDAPVAVATGERLTSLAEFSDLLNTSAVGFVRPDLCLVGGLTQGLKVAALAEAKGVGVIPHNWLSPINTAISVQLDATIPNFVLQEYTSDAEYPKNLFVPKPVQRDGGFLRVPSEPGLGIEVDLAAAAGSERGERSESMPAYDATIVTPLAADGSPADY